MIIGQRSKNKRYRVLFRHVRNRIAYSSNSINQRPLMIMTSMSRSMLVVSVDQMCIPLLVALEKASRL